MRSRLAWLQLALACVFAAVCARTDPDEVAVPAIFGSCPSHVARWKVRMCSCACCPSMRRRGL